MESTTHMLLDDLNLHEQLIDADQLREDSDLFCFICLERGIVEKSYNKKKNISKEDYSDTFLIRCCSLCSAHVHKKCWFGLRRTQKLGSLRSRLLGTNKQDPLRCTICKTGISKIEEETNLHWASNQTGNKEYLQDELLQTIGSLLTHDNRDDSLSSFHHRYIFLFNFFFSLFLILIIICMIFIFHFTANYVLLIALFVLYEVIVLQIVLYIYFRIQISSESL